jgi:hypothetical protein
MILPILGIGVGLIFLGGVGLLPCHRLVKVTFERVLEKEYGVIIKVG